MSDNQEVHVVTSGENDDYTIRAVFTEKALAEKFVEVFNSTHGGWGERAQVETYALNPFRQVLEGGRHYFKVVMHRDSSLDRPVEALPANLDKVSSHFIHADRTRLETCLWAANGADAVTIADKQRQLLIESGQW